VRSKRQGGKGGLPQVTVRLDPLIWNALRDIATQQSRSVGDLVSEIAHDSLTLAIHVYIAEFYRTEEPADPRQNDA
jgi:hypothetical protein